MINVGSELDALVAEVVMGEKKPSIEFNDDHSVLVRQLDGNPIKSPLGCWYLVCIYDHGDKPEWVPMPFSTDLETAMLLLTAENSRLRWVGSISSRGTFNFRLCNGHSRKDGYLIKADQWWVEYNTPSMDKIGPRADTAAHAICLAALQSCSEDMASEC